MGDPIGALWPFLALAVLGPAGADGLLLEGWVPQEEHFHKFLGKFVVDFNTAGTNVAQVETLVHPLGDVKIGAGRFYLAAFDDEEGHWQRIRDSWETTSCPELLKSASWSQTIVMSSNGDWNNTFGVRQRLRPRFWYFALLGCGVETTVPLRYSLHVTNTNFGWQSEVPVDHKDMIIINTLFVIAFFLTTLTTAWAARWREVMRKSPLRDHPYLQLLLCSQVASFASCALWVLHDCLYLRSGMGSMRLGFLAAMSATVASSTVFLIVILASTGWAIVTATLPCRRVFLGMVATVGGLSALCELHADTTTTQSSELYAYQSLPGFVALALKVFIFWWFLFQVKSTHEDEWDKRRRRFYEVLAICTTLLALHSPVSVVLSYSIAPWYRYRVVAVVDICTRWIGQAALSWLFLGSHSPISLDNAFSPQGPAAANTAHGDFGANQTEFQSLADDVGRPSLSI